MLPTLTLQAALLTAFPCQEALALESGAKSPCDGLLVPNADALTALHCARVSLPTCELELESAQKTCVIRLDAAAQEQDILMTRITHAEAVIKRLSVAKPQPWYESRLLWGGGGIVVGVGLTIAILKATLVAQ